MAKKTTVVVCWKRGHESDLITTRTGEEKIARQIPNLKAVCPQCKEQHHENQQIFIKEGHTILFPAKLYSCSLGHITTAEILGDTIHLRFGNQSINVAKDVYKNGTKCYHICENGQPCDELLSPVDDFELIVPQSAGIKTKTRLGDIWDRAGATPVRPGKYTKDGQYESDKSEVANRERLKKMRPRNLPAEKHPGSRIDKSTKRDYGYRSKDSVNPDRLKGPS